MTPIRKAIVLTPELRAQWHNSKNENFDITSLKGNDKPWWICEKGHEWKTTVCIRINGSSCSICANKKVLTGFNDLITTHPKLAAQWHPTKNENLNPKQVIAGTHKKVWWLGECGHSWNTSVNNRTFNNSKCPYCFGNKILAGFNDLTTTHPKLAAQWHLTKNENFDITLLKGNDKPWWICNLGHEWRTTVNHRKDGSQCPYCGNQKVLTGFNDLLTINSDLAAQWHLTKNGQLKPEEVMSYSAKKVWWICEKGHEWETTVAQRSAGHGCAVCSGNKVLFGFNDLETLNPTLAAEWHPAKNEQLRSSQVTLVSGKKIWWVCSKGHEWKTTVASRSTGKYGCPYCAGQKAINGVNDLATINPKLASEWHPTKNGRLKPEEIMSNSGKKVWWICEKGHEWKTAIISRNKGGGCVICGNKKILIGFNDLGSLSPDISAQWHPTKNGKLLPSNVSIGSGKKVWWICEKGHEWRAAVGGRVSGRTNCPTCTNKKILVGFNDLATLYPTVAAQWHPTKNKDLSPRQIVAGSEFKAWWLCDKNHKWQAYIYHRTNGTNCPICSRRGSKSEVKIYEYISSLNLGLVKTNTRKIIPPMELDIYIPEKKLAIEYNGLYWHSERFGTNKLYHYSKWLKCKEKGIQLIQIWEDDWNRNPELIKIMLRHKLGLSIQKKIFGRKTTVVVLNTRDVQLFLEENHIQRFANGSYYLGLEEKTTGKIVAALVLKKEGGSEGKILNIIRYATNANVIGGFTKLLSYAEKTYMPNKFVTFSDNCVSDGGLYENNGFVADKELPPDYMYVRGSERKHKFGYRLKNFKNNPELLWRENLTERQLAKLNGLERIWDAGKTRWIKEL